MAKVKTMAIVLTRETTLNSEWKRALGLPVMNFWCIFLSTTRILYAYFFLIQFCLMILELWLIAKADAWNSTPKISQADGDKTFCCELYSAHKL